MATGGLELIPHASAIHTRLGELYRVRRLLERQRRLSRKNAGHPLIPAERKIITRLCEIRAECRELRVQMKLSLEAMDEVERLNRRNEKEPAHG